MGVNQKPITQKDEVIGRGWPDLVAKTLDTLGHFGPWLILLCFFGLGLYQYDKMNRAVRKQVRTDFESATKALQSSYDLISDLNKEQTDNLKRAFQLQLRLNEELLLAREKKEIAAKEILKAERESGLANEQTKKAREEENEARLEAERALSRKSEIVKQLAAKEKELDKITEELLTTQKVLSQKEKTLDQLISKISAAHINNRGLIAKSEKLQSPTKSELVAILSKSSELFSEVEENIPFLDKPIPSGKFNEIPID